MNKDEIELFHPFFLKKKEYKNYGKEIFDT
jgi:hypothetical protein